MEISFQGNCRLIFIELNVESINRQINFSDIDENLLMLQVFIDFGVEIFTDGK